MIDQAKLQYVLRCYKRDFVSFMWNGKEYTWWKNEQYKWKAVKWFQENWKVNADDFPGMLKLALSETSNLLLSVNNFPRGMIEGFAKSSPEEVRGIATRNPPAYSVQLMPIHTPDEIAETHSHPYPESRRTDRAST